MKTALDKFRDVDGGKALRRSLRKRDVFLGRSLRKFSFDRERVASALRERKTRRTREDVARTFRSAVEEAAKHKSFDKERILEGVDDWKKFVSLSVVVAPSEEPTVVPIWRYFLSFARAARYL